MCGYFYISRFIKENTAAQLCFDLKFTMVQYAIESMKLCCNFSLFRIRLDPVDTFCETSCGKTPQHGFGIFVHSKHLPGQFGTFFWENKVSGKENDD